MKILPPIAAAALSVLATVPAGATTIMYSADPRAMPAGSSATVFQNFQSAPDGGTAYAPRAGEAVTGDVRVYSRTVTGQAVDPYGTSGDNYLSILNGSYSVAFAAPVQFFSFAFSSLDNYNSLLLTFSDTSTLQLTGRQILGESGVGPFNSSNAGRVSFDQGTGPGLVSAKFGSTQAAFEIDDLAASVPEPGAWTLTILGVGAVGFALRRRIIRRLLSLPAPRRLKALAAPRAA